MLIYVSIITVLYYIIGFPPQLKLQSFDNKTNHVNSILFWNIRFNIGIFLSSSVSSVFLKWNGPQMSDA